MGVLKARTGKKAQADSATEAGAETDAAKGEGEGAPELPSKTLPTSPSTTELLLRSHREKSQGAYKRAQQAEEAYRARKEADRARAKYSSSKSHLRTSCLELKVGLLLAFGAMRSSPAIVREQKVKAAGKRDIENEKKAEIQRRRLSAKLKRVQEQRAKLDEAAAGAVPAPEV